MKVLLPVIVKDPEVSEYKDIQPTETIEIEEDLFLDGPVSPRVAVLDFEPGSGALAPAARFVPPVPPAPEGGYQIPIPIAPGAPVDPLLPPKPGLPHNGIEETPVPVRTASTIKARTPPGFGT